MNEKSVNDSFTKLLEIVCKADETTPRDVRALARTLAEFGYYTAKEEDATDDANALLEEATEVFFCHVKELLDGNEEIKVGDRVRLLVDHPGGQGELVAGDLGCVRNVHRDCTYPVIGVEWDKKLADGHGHSVGVPTRCKKGHGWFIMPENLEKVPV